MQKILMPADLPVFCKCIIDGLNDYDETCQLKTSELLIILFPIVAHQLHHKTFNDILSMISNYVYRHICVSANNFCLFYDLSCFPTK